MENAIGTEEENALAEPVINNPIYLFEHSLTLNSLALVDQVSSVPLRDNEIR